MPLIILLMNVGRKTYELMQLWVDSHEDTVRDVLHAIQRHLAKTKTSWRQDYDGLFSIRNHKYTQLIHLLNISKYDPKPYEVWIAKPWAMANKITQMHASDVLILLRNMELARYYVLKQKRSFAVLRKSEEHILQLTSEARERRYTQGPLLRHYHAGQFLSFSPLFQPKVVIVQGLDILGGGIEKEKIDITELSQVINRRKSIASRLRTNQKATIVTRLGSALSNLNCFRRRRMLKSVVKSKEGSRLEEFNQAVSTQEFGAYNFCPLCSIWEEDPQTFEQTITFESITLESIPLLQQDRSDDEVRAKREC
jgi:hypothetical protein